MGLHGIPCKPTLSRQPPCQKHDGLPSHKGHLQGALAEGLAHEMVCRGEEKVKVSAPQGWASSAPHALLPKGGMSPGSLAHSPQGPPNMVRSCQATRIEGFFRGPGRVAHFADVEVCLPLLLFMRAVPSVGFVVFRPATMVVMVRRVGTTRNHVAPLVAPLHAPKPCEKQKHGRGNMESSHGDHCLHGLKLRQPFRSMSSWGHRIPQIRLRLPRAFFQRFPPSDIHSRVILGRSNSKKKTIHFPQLHPQRLRRPEMR